MRMRPREVQLSGAFDGDPLPAASNHDCDGGASTQVGQLARPPGGYERDDVVAGYRMGRTPALTTLVWRPVVGAPCDDDAEAVVLCHQVCERGEIDHVHLVAGVVGRSRRSSRRSP
jgi:hypothetical protein